MPSLVLSKSDRAGWLFLGNQDDAINPAFINEHTITRFIHVCRDCRCVYSEGDPNHLRIAINDSPNENIRNYFEEAIQFLAKAKSDGAHVLVHCYAGISRSPTIVLAYLINDGREYSEAVRFLKEKRECIDPQLAFLGALLNFERTIRAI